MAQKPKYVELKFSSADVPSHALSGYEIVSDYTDSDGKRRLFLKRPDPVVQEATPKKTRKRRKGIGSVLAAPTDAKSQTGFSEQDRG